MKLSHVRKRLRSSLKSVYLDVGGANDAVVLAGMGRSGTTWLAELVNADGRDRIVFEPFFAARVPEAAGFDYLQYLRPSQDAPLLVGQARAILAGKVRNAWVDRDNQGWFYRHRIIKDIRCNLMLAWLKAIAPAIPIVLIVRHPLAVTASWLKLGWGKELDGDRTDVDILTAQPALFEDFPVLGDLLDAIDPMSRFEQILFEWCVLHLVPYQQFQAGGAHLLFYENLVLQPERELRSLFEFLQKPFDWGKMQSVVGSASSTNFLKRSFRDDRMSQLDRWQESFDAAQRDRASQILARCGLDSFYNEAGQPAQIHVSTGRS
ncbi:MAG: sulfotransferase domain-containing protein [Synechococcales bacterium]|nr:sulfotransferase domain-containing protein [Synechococcales bacterium]